jgi:hypothetical protein
MDVERWTFDALRRVQRYKRHRAKVPLVRHEHREWKHELVPGNKIAQVRFRPFESRRRENFSLINEFCSGNPYEGTFESSFLLGIK